LEFLKKIPSKRVDMILTDPPYGISNDLLIDRSNFRNPRLRHAKSITGHFGDWDRFRSEK